VTTGKVPDDGYGQTHLNCAQRGLEVQQLGALGF